MSKSQIIDDARKQGRTLLSEIESKQILPEAGINTTLIKLASSENEAVNISQNIGFPVVLKIASPDITHKSDAGGVKVGLKNETEVSQAYQEIMVLGQAALPGRQNRRGIGAEYGQTGYRDNYRHDQGRSIRSGV